MPVIRFQIITINIWFWHGPYFLKITKQATDVNVTFQSKTCEKQYINVKTILVINYII